MPKKQKAIYLAHSLGYSEAGQEFLLYEMIPRIGAIGFNIIDPWISEWSEEFNKAAKLRFSKKKIELYKEHQKRLTKRDIDNVKKSNLVVAILDGPIVDEGVASTIGFAYGLKKPMIGYLSDHRQYAGFGMLTINPQIEYFIKERDGKIVKDLDELEDELRDIYEKLK